MTVFFDTSVLLAGLIDFGPQSAPAQSLLHAVTEGRVAGPATSWHCCLEFFSAATRLPPEYRLAPGDAVTLLEQEVFARIAVHDLPAPDRAPMLRAAAHDLIAGGRIYDAHIAEVARAAGASVIVTDNRATSFPLFATTCAWRPPRSSSRRQEIEVSVRSLQPRHRRR